MAEQTAVQRPAHEAQLRAGDPFHPRLGDLAADLAKGGNIGVVVTLPSDTSASYHLRPPGGGPEWSARADGTTLRPVPAKPTHITPMQGDVIYDHRAEQAALPVVIQNEDGGSTESVLILTPSQVELYYIQLGQLIERREEARGAR
ncbi:hypothetical protein [Streptomyces sp. NBC_00239]|uniref:hypothetical protein n=1 Tax=Streptomyces sp. NBC_00239 TaxID=2903640 RepID=UPI002E289977|nr:hypothetical protein [Streptomyces sp. NBC_00239]